MPVFSFGENEVYDAKMQELAQKIDLLLKLDRVGFAELWNKSFWFKFLTEFVNGCIYFFSLFTTLPKMRPLNTVVGKPIPVSQVDEPTQEQIDQLHSTYIHELTSLFNQHKGTYLDDKTIELEII